MGDLAAGRRGAALSIDFFAKSARMGGEPVRFRYAASTLLSPAYVAQLAHAPHPQAAQRFIDFVLSNEGQALLLAPDVARLPVRPSAYPQDAAFNPFAAGISVPAFDLNEAESRLGLLAAVFDSHIGERHAQLKQYLARIDAVLLSAQGDALARLEQARALLLRPVHIHVRNVSNGFGERRLLEDFSLRVMRGDRLGIIGNNGVGKSTLLRILLGELTPEAGTVKIGTNVVPAYFDQLRREIDPSKTVAKIIGEGRDYVTVAGCQKQSSHI